MGAMPCGWYDLVTSDCNGNAPFTIDRTNFVLGTPEVEKYTCPVKKTQLDLAIYHFRYLKDEMKWRAREIRKSLHHKRNSCDAELSKVFPIRISVRRSNRDFRDFVCAQQLLLPYPAHPVALLFGLSSPYANESGEILKL
jgi:hypothetical protein